MNKKIPAALIIICLLFSTTVLAKSSYRFKSSFSGRSSSSFGSGKSFNFKTPKSNPFSSNTKGSYNSSKGSGFSIFGKKPSASSNSVDSVSKGVKSKSALDSLKNKNTPVNNTKPSFDYLKTPNKNSAFYRSYNYAPPRYYSYGRPSFGLWDAMFLWFMLDHLNNDRYVKFYASNANDPNMIKWRQEAEKQAKDNKELREKLDKLDKEKTAYVASNKPLDSKDIPKEALYQPVAIKPAVKAQDVAVVSLGLLFIGSMSFILFRYR